MEPFYGEAQMVTKALMQRVRQNISLLVSRLTVLGYRFGEGMWGEEDEFSLEEKLLFEQDMPIFRLPTTETSLLVEKLEQVVGTLPLSLFYWYKEVGCVNLVGLFPSKGEQKFGRKEGSYLDPLFVYSVELALRMVSDYRERNVWEKDPTLPISPDSLSKYDYSGAGPYTIKMPCKAFDAPLLRERHHTTFINYLRTCIKWGGFPGLEQNNVFSQKDFDFLTSDLLPF